MISALMIGAFLLGALTGAIAKSRPVHPRMLVCGHCGATKDGHEGKAMKCPCLWRNVKGELSGIKFFKPLTMEEWLAREGLS